tara:strand:+ start:2873 stop:3187 length:315 start_codon:yes stop_codon:yes gene_type:complete
MKWEDNPLLWEKLDDFLINSAGDAKNFLDVLYEHESEIHPMLKGILFGGFGQLIMSYNVSRTELNEPNMSLALALEKVMSNPLFGQVMAANITNVIDKTVENLE